MRSSAFCCPWQVLSWAAFRKGSEVFRRDVHCCLSFGPISIETRDSRSMARWLYLASFDFLLYDMASAVDDAGEIETVAFRLGADGATAPETLRPKDRNVRTIWRETLNCWRPPKGTSAWACPARIKLSGTVTDGALGSAYRLPGDSYSRETH